MDSEITKVILRLGCLCGMGNSESATEEFVTHLFDCASQVINEIEQSHEKGLCLDAVRALSDRLEKTAAERIASLN
jgi:hypothetical protein